MYWREESDFDKQHPFLPEFHLLELYTPQRGMGFTDFSDGIC